MVGGSVLFGAYTGKAALVLQQKGCIGASTLHSITYRASENPDTGIISWVVNPESPIGFTRLLIVDEVSMVGQELGEDIKSFGTRILVFGDPFQLPPIEGAGYFTNVEPDVMMTDIVRQAADNPIIAVATHIRNGGVLKKPGRFGESRILSSKEFHDDMGGILSRSDQLLVGMNKTRRAYNEFYRSALWDGKAEQETPLDGDKMICLKNNHQKGLLNGSLWEATKVKKDTFGIGFVAKSLDVNADVYVDVRTHPFFLSGREKELDWRDKKLFDEFDYGYAITVHKSQGSQWDNVVVIDESGVFRETAARHLYTAVTRAAERVHIVI